MWDAIGLITSGLTLVGFIAAISAWIYSRKLHERERLIATASEAHRADLVAMALEFFKIDASMLSKRQQYDLAVQQISARAHRFTVSAIVVVTLALMCGALAVVAIVYHQPEAITSDIELPAFDASELAGEFYAEIGGPYGSRLEADRLKDQVQRLVDDLSSFNDEVDAGSWSYDVGLFFGKSDVCVDRSLSKQDAWIVGIDLIRHDPDGETEIQARKKLDSIKSRLSLLDSPTGKRIYSMPDETRVLLDSIRPKIANSELKEYGVAQYMQLYGRELRNTRHLD